MEIEHKSTATSRGLSGATLTVIGLISVALAVFFKGYSFIAIVGIITLPMAFVRSYRERKQKQNSDFKFGIVDSLIVVVVTVIIVGVILNII